MKPRPPDRSNGNTPTPGPDRSWRWVLGALAVIVLLSQFSQTKQFELGDGLAYGLVMLSLVVVTGYGGFVSMAQLSFMGVGAAVATGAALRKRRAARGTEG